MSFKSELITHVLRSTTSETLHRSTDANTARPMIGRIIIFGDFARFRVKKKKNFTSRIEQYRMRW